MVLVFELELIQFFVSANIVPAVGIPISQVRWQLHYYHYYYCWCYFESLINSCTSTLPPHSPSLPPFRSPCSPSRRSPPRPATGPPSAPKQTTPPPPYPSLHRGPTPRPAMGWSHPATPRGWSHLVLRWQCLWVISQRRPLMWWCGTYSTPVAMCTHGRGCKGPQGNCKVCVCVCVCVCVWERKRETFFSTGLLLSILLFLLLLFYSLFHVCTPTPYPSILQLAFLSSLDTHIHLHFHTFFTLLPLSSSKVSLCIFNTSPILPSSPLHP